MSSETWLKASPAQLRRSASMVDDDARSLRKHRPTDVLRRVAQALPGAGAGPTAALAGEALATDLSALAMTISDQAGAMRQAAATFAATDAQGSHELSSAGSP